MAALFFSLMPRQIQLFQRVQILTGHVVPVVTHYFTCGVFAKLPRDRRHPRCGAGRSLH